MYMMGKTQSEFVSSSVKQCDKGIKSLKAFFFHYGLLFNCLRTSVLEGLISVFA